MSKNSIAIAIITRTNLYSVPGGDTIQITKTAEYLTRCFNIDVDILLNKKINYDKYSLIHFFNIICPDDILSHVYKSSLPYVISPIYVNYREYDYFHRKDLIGLISKFLNQDRIEYLKTFLRFTLLKKVPGSFYYFLKGHKESIKYIIQHSAFLLPNSENEYKRLEHSYSVSKNYVTVPNAVDSEIFKIDNNVKRDIILCVGRIEGRKNQLNVIRALKNTNYQIIFIGNAAPNQQKYYEKCRSEATSNMQFLNFMEQKHLLPYYQRARVHILASWFETTGLSSLEAGVMGCSLVIGDRGDVKEYFKDDVEYCNPNDLDSILKAVSNAWSKEIKYAFIDRIKSNYTWEKAAEKTLIAYNQILNID